MIQYYGLQNRSKMANNTSTCCICLCVFLEGFCNAWLNAHYTGNECKFMAIFFALLFGACGVLEQQWRSCFYIFVMCTSITCMLLPLLLEQCLLCVFQSKKRGNVVSYCLCKIAITRRICQAQAMQ